MREGIAILYVVDTVKIDQRPEISEGGSHVAIGGEIEPTVINKQKCLCSGVTNSVT